MPTEKSQDKNIRIGGTKPRPRVALLGEFKRTEVKQYKKLFPTTYTVQNISSLATQVSYSELDLLIIAPGVNINQETLFYIGRNDFWNLLVSFVHVICFSVSIESLPGPTPNTPISIARYVDTEEYLLPEISLPYSRRREADLVKKDNAKGWPLLGIKLKRSRTPSEIRESKIAADKFKKGAIILDSHTKYPFATIYQRDESNLGVAWLPQSFFDQVSWVVLIVTEWAKSDQKSFPGFGDWTKLFEWMVPKEEELAKKISALEGKKQNTIQQIDKEIGTLQSDLTEATLEANKGVRRLLTAQGDELVDEVANTFDKIGFKVQIIDKELEPNKPKREDLRLQNPSEQKEDWEAIVEVRGYAKSAGTTGDLSRLGRFEKFYIEEKGRPPDKKVYVVNGQTGISNPQQRQEPLISTQEDVQIFAEDKGVIISTIDLFRLVKNLQHFDHATVRESIKKAEGRWTIESVNKFIERSGSGLD